ncbi:hypothetical protein B0J14DRAFT_571265 [Halenospora varia]|nr:hypothetical protein B0J14DRAFT_571265 [Halenospora varia]
MFWNKGAIILSISNLSIFSSDLRYNSRPKFGLYDRRKRHERGDDPNWDGIEVAEDALVYPGILEGPTLYKGAMLMPNTFTMQEFVRTEIDYYIGNKEVGKQVDIPYIYTI